LHGEVSGLRTLEDLDVISTLASCPAWTRLAPQRRRQTSLRQEAKRMVHVGVDLDKRSSQIAVLSEDGEIVQHRLANDAARLEKFFADLPPHTPIAIEASGTWWWLVDLLDELGHQPVPSNPIQTTAIAAARLKNDRVDAERLALLLRGDLLPKVWIPPTALR